jgi:hypothetical protein
LESQTTDQDPGRNAGADGAPSIPEYAARPAANEEERPALALVDNARTGDAE